jgi:hypothetical protein
MGSKSTHHVYDMKGGKSKLPTRIVEYGLNKESGNYVKYDESLPNISTPIYFSDDFSYYLTFETEKSDN